jgi:hypothetical protein
MIFRSDEAECDGLGTRHVRGRTQQSLTEIATLFEKGTSKLYRENRIPDGWRNAVTAPIFRKGDEREPKTLQSN